MCSASCARWTAPRCFGCHIPRVWFLLIPITNKQQCVCRCCCKWDKRSRRWKGSKFGKILFSTTSFVSSALGERTAQVKPILKLPVGCTTKTAEASEVRLWPSLLGWNKRFSRWTCLTPTCLRRGRLYWGPSSHRGADGRGELHPALH